MTSFMVFSGEMRNKVKEENPDMKLVEIASELGRRWKALTDEEKKPYQDKADADKERFNEEMEGYVVPKEFRKRKKRKRSKSKSSTKKKKAKKSAKKKTKRRTKSITTRPEPLFENSRYMLTKNAPKPSKKRGEHPRKLLWNNRLRSRKKNRREEEESEESEDESEESEDESEESEEEEEEEEEEELVGVKKVL